MRRRDLANTLQRRLIIEQHVSAAVHLQIDKSRGEPCTLRQDPHGDRPRHLPARHDLRDASAVHDHGRTLVHGGTVEDMIGHNGVQCWLDHLVRVTFCKCRGRSTLVPRHCATRMASA